jgi:hypothetical protein
MKYQIRKVEEITIWQATEVVELDPKKFKKLEENPYNGNSEEDFLKYIAEFVNKCRYDGVPYDLDSKTADELDKMIENVKWTEYANSCEKGENSWYEIGEKDESYRRSGGFNSHHDTIEKPTTLW